MFQVQRSERADAHSEARQDSVDPLTASPSWLGDALVVQAKGHLTGDVRRLASEGISGSGSRLPHLDKIQASFGSHDVSHVQAHTDGAAAAASAEMGANAYATGDHVAFGAKADLHTAAHEAAHVVQQQAGVQLSGGVGAPGDTYERHADAVADKVVKGESASSLLDQMAGVGGAGVQMSSTAVQMDPIEESDLASPLRLPDKLGADAKLKVTSAVNTKTNARLRTASLDLTSGTAIKITAPDDGGETGIQVYRWEGGDINTYVKYQGTVPTAAVTLGGTEQTALDDEAQVLPAHVGGIKQEDVYQNGVSDCWFQAAMIAVASTKPAAIMDAVTDQPDANKVLVKFYDAMGARRTYSLNRSLFVDGDGNPVYGGKKGTYLWPAFMGKALAVQKGGYQEAAMGLACTGMRMITGEGNGSVIKEKSSDPASAYRSYDYIRNTLASEAPLVLGTTSFAKEGFWAKFKNSFKTPSGVPSSKPSGQVRGLHSYAVLAMDKMDLTDKDFESSWPDATLTLRDPRDTEGNTFTRKLKDVLTSGKFQNKHSG